jgi:hypothetical protein
MGRWCDQILFPGNAKGHGKLCRDMDEEYKVTTRAIGKE